MKQRFGEFLIKKGVIDPFSLVKALNIQRRRGLIPLGEIALHDKLLSPDKLLAILDVQENTGRRFGDIALEHEFLNQTQIDVLIKKQAQLHSRIGEILVEMNKVTLVELEIYLKEFSDLDVVEAEEDVENVNADVAPALLISSNVCCPICEETSVQHVVDNSLYQIEKNDIDFKPSVYKWDNPEYKDVSPLLYEFWECPYCSFALSHDDFEGPTKDMPASLSNFRKKVIDLLTKNEEVNHIVDVLSSKGDEPEITYASVAKKNLLAINLYSKIPMLAEQEGVPLAQLCLNLGWIYRDMHKVVSDGIYAQEMTRVKSAIGEFWADVPLTETAALEMALHYYDIAVYQSRTLVERGIEHKILQLMARINIRLKRIKEARKLLLDTVMNGNKQIAALKSSLRPESSEFNKAHNKDVMQDLCRVNAFVKETKALLEFCSTLK